MTANELRADLIRRGLIKPTSEDVFHVKPHNPRTGDDRPAPVKVKSGRSKSPQYGRR